MSCEHKRLKSVDCVLYCADCGAKIEKETTFPVPDGATPPKGEGMEKPKRTRKKKTEENKA